MPRIPKYRLHPASGRGIVQYKPLYGSSPHYLPGAFNSPESLAGFKDAIAAILKYMQGQQVEPQQKPIGDATVFVMLREWRRAAVRHYGSDKDREFRHMLNAALHLNAVAGGIPVGEFGPKLLKDVRQHMVKAGLSRPHVNRQVNRIRRIFKWGVEEEWLDASVLANLQAVAGLRKGKTSAREPEAIRPVAWETVAQLLPYLSPIIAAMVELQYLTGMRSDELTRINKGEMLFGDVWTYSPVQHKTGWAGLVKVICIGPRGQAILAPYLSDGFIFTPAKALAELSAARTRKTPRYGRRSRPRPRQDVSARYSTSSYQHAINHGFAKWARRIGGGNRPKGERLADWLARLGIEYWHPHQLRHTRATATRAAYGVEGAQAQTGNTLEATEIYAEKSLPLARKIALETG